MSISKRMVAAVSGLTAVGLSAGLLLAGPANAATPVAPWEPDAAAVGNITFYDASGNVVTSGTTDGGAGGNTVPFAAYLVGSANPHAGDTQFRAVYANPSPNGAPYTWFRNPPGLYITNPVSSGPANIQALSATNPVVAMNPEDQNLDDFRSSAVHYTDSGYDNVVQIRIQSTPAGANQPSVKYDVADILINPTAHTWTQIYPATTTTALTASPSSPQVGDSVTLTATETPAAAGSVQFSDGTTVLGTATVDTTTGKATLSTSTLAKGAHSLSAVFTPTSIGYAASTGTASLTIAPPSVTVKETASTGTEGDDASFSVTVKDKSGNPLNAGTVDFFLDGATTALNSSPVTGTAGVFSYTKTGGFPAGSHTVVAKFTPTDSGAYQAGQDSVSFAITPRTCSLSGSQCSATGNVNVVVPDGTLTITTPYTSSNPINLGTMTLNNAITQLTASTAIAGIQVTDRRTGNNSYTVSALSSVLSDGRTNAGSKINAQNVGLTGVIVTNGTGFGGTTTTTDNAAANPAVAAAATGSAGLGGATAHTVVGATNSVGSISIGGTLTVNAPTSTESGTFAGVITFTVG